MHKKRKHIQFYYDYFLYQQQLLLCLAKGDNHCIERANRKCAWFGSPNILLSGVLNLLSAQKCNTKHVSLTSIKTASIY